MNKQHQATAVVATLYSTRMLGLFMLLPVFSLYAHELDHTTPFLIGIALGIYGLTQACFQIPFGMLSDRFGRKPVITGGLLLFVGASIVAAMSHSIWGIIIARALQGMGAIGSSLLAMLADSTDETYRVKAMAVIGMIIGISFGVSMLIAPVISGHFGVPGIFWFTAIIASIGIVLLHTAMPPIKQIRSNDNSPAPKMLLNVLRNKELLRLNLGILVQHGLLTGMFTVLPMTLLHSTGLARHQHWHVYLPVMLLSFLTMVPAIMYAEKRKKIKLVFIIAVVLSALGQALLGLWDSSYWEVMVALYLYFAGFNILEAMLPSLISRAAPPECKGTAMGVYSTAQFLGIFLGGGAAGLLSGYHHAHVIYGAGAAIALVWLLLSLGMPNTYASRLTASPADNGDVDALTTPN